MQTAKALRPLVLGLILCSSHSRTFSLINGYGAPIEIYKHLEHHDDAGTGKNQFLSNCFQYEVCDCSQLTSIFHVPISNIIFWRNQENKQGLCCSCSNVHFISSVAGSVVCVGSEWHRFPSSFFVPDYVGEVRWIDDGFRGLLPFPFNSSMGGTSAAPPYFNNKNKAVQEQYVMREMFMNHSWKSFSFSSRSSSSKSLK